MHCGFLPRDKWVGDKPQVPERIGGQEYTGDVCPAWLVRQVAVIEGAQAYSAKKDGCLQVYYPECENTVLEAALEVERAVNMYEQSKTEQMKHRG